MLNPKTLHTCQTLRARGYSRAARCARRQLNPRASAGACYDIAQLHIRPHTSERLQCSLTYEIATALALPADPTTDARAKWERNIGELLPIANRSAESRNGVSFGGVGPPRTGNVPSCAPVGTGRLLPLAPLTVTSRNLGSVLPSPESRLRDLVTIPLLQLFWSRCMGGGGRGREPRSACGGLCWLTPACSTPTLRAGEPRALTLC